MRVRQTGHLALAAAAAILLSAGPTSAQPVQPDYHPSLADLMTMAVQPRHIKLWYGGKARNWPYAAYEASELKNAFARVARTVPTHHSNDMATMMAANIKGPLEAVDAAIKARDPARFDAAYVQLTQACNACHQGLDRSDVVIQVPRTAMYPDQSFLPAAATQRTTPSGKRRR
jgi:hypothetical protein